MSIQISIKTVGLNINANVKDTALPAIVALIQEHRDDTAPTQLAPQPAIGISDEPMSEGSNDSLDNESGVKAALAKRGAAEILNQLKWESYPEKILLLGAWNEAKGGSAPWRSADMDEVFTQQAKEKPPGNFPRDIKVCIKSGWVHAATARTYIVTRTGWNKIGQALGSSPT